MSEYYLFAVTGITGCGKTTIAKYLSIFFNAFYIPENWEDNPYLKSFYSGKKIFKTQKWFIKKDIKRLKKAISYKKTNNVVIEKLFIENEAFKEGNFEPLKALEAPGVVYHRGSTRDMVGHEAHKQDIMNYRRSTSNHRQEWDYVTGDGNVCVLSIKETMTFVTEHPVVSVPAGKTIEFDALFVLRRENEKIAEAWIKGSSTVK